MTGKCRINKREGFTSWPITTKYCKRTLLRNFWDTTTHYQFICDVFPKYEQQYPMKHDRFLFVCFQFSGDSVCWFSVGVVCLDQLVLANNDMRRRYLPNLQRSGPPFCFYSNIYYAVSVIVTSTTVQICGYLQGIWNVKLVIKTYRTVIVWRFVIGRFQHLRTAIPIRI